MPKFAITAQLGFLALVGLLIGADAQVSEATSDEIRAMAVLALPGWFVERKGRSDVMVVSGREICSVFPKAGAKAVLTPDQVKRIAFQLEQRCRNVEVE